MLVEYRNNFLGRVLRPHVPQVLIFQWIPEAFPSQRIEPRKEQLRQETATLLRTWSLKIYIVSNLARTINHSINSLLCQGMECAWAPDRQSSSIAALKGITGKKLSS